MFQFKQFRIHQDRCNMKVGTDGVLLGAWANVTDATRILDIGTGTGIIALMLAQRNPLAQIDALEIDSEAFAQATENMQHAPWANRLSALHSSVQEYALAGVEKYDLIVSNPPFFSGGTFSSNHNRTSVRHTVKLPHGALLLAVQRLIHPGGRFGVVLPYLEGLRFKELAQNYHLYGVRTTEVRAKKDKPIERLLMEFSCTPDKEEVDQLILQHAGHNAWTEAYMELTKDFYLSF